MRVNCKHVAAVLLRALKGGERPEPRPPQAWSPPLQPEVRPARTAPAAIHQLPLEIDLWLDRAERTTKPKAGRTDYGPNVLQRLLYVLRLPDPSSGGNAQVQLTVARRLKAGGYSGAAPWTNARQAVHQPSSFVLAEDQRILRMLLLDATRPYDDSFVLSGETGTQILRAMLATGRCHVFESGSTPALRALRVREICAGSSSPTACSRSPATPSHPVIGWCPLPRPGIWISSGSNAVRSRRVCSRSLAEALAGVPGVRPEHAARAREAILARLPGVEIPLPQVPEETEVRDTPPIPCLRLITLQAYGRGYRPLSHFVDVAVLSFDYAGARVDRNSPRKVQIFNGGRLLHIQRDARSEKRFHDALKGAGFVQLSELTRDYPSEHQRDYALRNPAAWPEFVCEQLPQLQAGGWRVEVDDNFRFKPIEHVQWYAASPGGRSGLVRSEPGCGCRRAAPGHAAGPDRGAARTPRVAVRAGSKRFGQGRLALLAAGRRQAAAGPPRTRAADAVDTARAARRTSRRQGPSPAAGCRAAGRPGTRSRSPVARGRGLRALGKRLAGFEQIAAVLAPEGFGAQLRPYQEQGLAWLQFLREFGLGGILADDMGLGKTVQALAHILLEKQAGRLDRPALVVAPTSVLPNWRAEAARFAPQLRVHVSHGLKRKTSFAQIGAHDVVLTTYPLLARDKDALLAQEFHLVILDEAQQVKNAQTQAARVVGQLRARNRLCLTGTPLENNLGELWSLVNFLMPGLLGDASTFRRLYRTPIEKHADEARRDSLARRIRPFLLRRTKEQVATELPAKSEILHPVELAGAQRDLYETVRASMHERVRAEIAARGLAPEPHHRPRRAVEAAAGLLRSASAEGRRSQKGQGVGQARSAARDAGGTAARRPPHSPVLAIHQHAGTR